MPYLLNYLLTYLLTWCFNFHNKYRKNNKTNIILCLKLLLPSPLINSIQVITECHLAWWAPTCKIRPESSSWKQQTSGSRLRDGIDSKWPPSIYSKQEGQYKCRVENKLSYLSKYFPAKTHSTLRCDDFPLPSRISVAHDVRQAYHFSLAWGRATSH